MTSTKRKGSSRCKGKEIAANDLATKIVDEDAPLSKLECSKEEEGSRDPDSKCAPLIDLRYNTHAHFSVVPGDYLPPSSSHVWLSICCIDMEVSRAPLVSSIPDLVCQGTSLPVPILFEFELGTSLGWKEWVDEELSNTGFMTAL